MMRPAVPTSRDPQVAAFAAAHRRRLLGTALLVGGDAGAAERVVHAVLAHGYAAWPTLADPVRQAYAAVVGRSSLGVALPWEQPQRFELVDTAPARPGAPGLLAGLAPLSREERAVLALRRYARLSLVDTAAVTGQEPLAVRGIEARAVSALASTRAAGWDPATLPAELRQIVDAALPADKVEVQAVRDLAAGQRLLGRRRIRALAAAAVLVAGLALGLRLAVPLVAPTPTVTPPPAAAPVPARCDIADERCRVQVVSDWRQEMADVISSHLDPKGRYFTGYSYSYADSYNGRGVWDASGGALGLDLYRINGGSTQVSLQIATRRANAIPCGQTTGRDCFNQRFMDGNRFILTDTSTASDGVEVQHAPKGTYVITLIARDSGGRGERLPVTVGDLMGLAMDERLQLPPR